MMHTAGNIQTNKVSSAKTTPPLLNPTKTMVCVEDAPGNN